MSSNATQSYSKALDAGNALKRLKMHPVSSWIIWVGAGVSSDNPTSLPKGIDLTEFVVNTVFGSDVNKSLKKLWKEANVLGRITGLSEPFGALPRLETVLEVVSNVEKSAPALGVNFMSGIESFQEAPFNVNHICIAELLAQGATIITTNFDTCIQKAFFHCTGYEMRLNSNQEKGLYCYTSDMGSAGSIWHLHGVAAHIASMRTTIRSVKEGLPYELQFALDGLFSDKKAALFLGYSASDVFDVNLYFNQKSASQFSNCHIFFCTHATSDVPVGVKSIFHPFNVCEVFQVNTQNFLVELAHLDSNKYTFNTSNEWKSIFLKTTSLVNLEFVNGYAICRLSFEFGVSYKKLHMDAYKNAVNNAEHFDTWELHRTLAANCRMIEESKLERAHDNLAGDNKLLGFYYSQGDDQAALKVAKDLTTLLRESDDDSVELSWDTYTSMSTHCRPIIRKYLKDITRKTVLEAELTQIVTLLQLTDRLSDRPLKNVTFLNQVATAMRFSTLFRALLFGNEDIEAEERILRLYAEASSIQGYVSSYRDFAIKRIFLAKRFGNRRFLSEAQAFSKKSKKLAELIGDVRAKQYATTLQYLITFYRVFLLFRIDAILKAR